MQIISVIFCNGLSDQQDIAFEATGDGTARILLRLTRISGGSGLVFGKWEGFTQ